MDNDVADLLQEISLAENLTNEELNLVGNYVDLLEIDGGTIIFSEGSPGEFVLFVVEGILDVTKKSINGDETGIAILSKGDLIGEMALIDNMERSATVRARTASKLLVLTKDKLDDLLESTPHTGIEILKGIARTLSFNLRRTSSDLAIGSNLIFYKD